MTLKTIPNTSSDIMDSVYNTGSLLDDFERACAETELELGGCWPPPSPAEPITSPTHSYASGDDSGTGSLNGDDYALINDVCLTADLVDDPTMNDFNDLNFLNLLEDTSSENASTKTFNNENNRNTALSGKKGLPKQVSNDLQCSSAGFTADLSVDPVISIVSDDDTDENSLTQGNDIALRVNRITETAANRLRSSSRIASKSEAMPVTSASVGKDHGYVLKLIPSRSASENQSPPSAVAQSKLPKAPKSVYSKIVEDPSIDKTTKVVIQARLNRQKKKEYIQGLESEVAKYKSENGELKQREKQWEKHRRSLEEEIVYLKSVLANESGLSSLLKNINGLKNVHLSSSFAQKRKIETDHDYSTKRGVSTSGVCLHVDSDEVSLEFCSRCSNQSKRSRRDADT